MPFEIELKARLDDAGSLKEKLSELGSYFRSYGKKDSYWHVPDSASGVRLRSESGLYADGQAYESSLVTCKNKKIVDGMEISEENEIFISDAGLFEDMLISIGMNMKTRKDKQGWAWKIPPEADGESFILAELSLVAGLGWFLELEIISADSSAQIIAGCRMRLLSLLDKLEIPRERIEAKPYTVLLNDALLMKTGEGAAGIKGD